MVRLRIAVATVVLLSVPAMAKPKPAPKPKLLPPVHFVCEDGTRLAVTYTAPGVSPSTATVRILGTDKELALTQAEAADGARYTGGKTELWDKGATASFTQDGAALNCRKKK